MGRPVGEVQILCMQNDSRDTLSGAIGRCPGLRLLGVPGDPGSHPACIISTTVVVTLSATKGTVVVG